MARIDFPYANAASMSMRFRSIYCDTPNRVQRSYWHMITISLEPNNRSDDRSSRLCNVGLQVAASAAILGGGCVQAEQACNMSDLCTHSSFARFKHSASCYAMRHPRFCVVFFSSTNTIPQYQNIPTRPQRWLPVSLNSSRWWEIASILSPFTVSKPMVFHSCLLFYGMLSDVQGSTSLGVRSWLSRYSLVSTIFLRSMLSSSLSAAVLKVG
jgi:hypothetical protein